MRWLKLSIGFAVTAGFVWLLAREVDLDALGQAFAGLSVSTVLLALAFLAAGWAVRIVRWWWMLRTLVPTLPLGVCAGPFLAGMAVNNVAPLRAGDALRVLGFRRQLRAPTMAVAGTLVVERILDVAVLTALLFLGLLGLPAGAFPPGFVVVAASLAGGGIAALVVLPLLAPVLGRVWERLVGRRTFGGWRWTQAVSSQGALLIEALRLVRSGPRTLVLIGLSAVAWASEGAAFVTVAAAIRAGAEPMGPWFSPRGRHPHRRHPQCAGLCRDIRLVRRPRHPSLWRLDGVAVAFALTTHAVLWASSTAAGLFCLLAHSIRPWRARGLPSVPARRESSAPPTTDKLPAMPQASAAAIRAGTAGEARCER